MCHIMCVNETINSYMILNNVIGSFHHYHNILFVIVRLLCIHNVVSVKHDVSSVFLSDMPVGTIYTATCVGTVVEYCGRIMECMHITVWHSLFVCFVSHVHSLIHPYIS